MPLVQISLKGRALRLLSGREYSRTELERKLERFEEEAGALARVLDELQVKGFISDQRVIESVLHRRANRLGTARVKQELQGKGLDPSSVAQAVDQLRNTEVARAREVWRKKFGVVAVNAAQRSKQLRFLVSRGFGGEAIRRVISGASDDD